MKKTIIFLTTIFLIIGLFLNFENILYNIGNYFYQNKEYQKSINFYSKLKFDKDLLLKSNYNIGNAYYRLSESKRLDENLLKLSLENYFKALKIKKDDKETNENINFILNKILEKKQKEKQEQSNKENTGSGSEKKEQSNKENTGSGSEKKEQSNKDILSVGEMKKIEEYSNGLLNDQYNNIDQFGKEFYFDNLQDNNQKDW